MTFDQALPNRADPLLARLLGPSAAEVSCDRCFDQLDRYVELERGPAAADDLLPGMRAHFEGCPACREEHDSLRDLLECDRLDRWG